MEKIIDLEEKKFSHLVDDMIKLISLQGKTPPESILIRRYYESLVDNMPNDSFDAFYTLAKIYLNELLLIKSGIESNSVKETLEYHLCAIEALPHHMLMLWDFGDLDASNNPIMIVPSLEDKQYLEINEYISIAKRLLKCANDATMNKNNQMIVWLIDNYMCLSLKEIAEVA